ncbi:MAG: S9 family peptidase [Chloroflexi bacterium]|nr:S9 family peptidase [Chloroflexota bacterium]
MKVTAGMVARMRALAEPRWSPDGRRLAYLESFDGRGDVIVVDGSSPEESGGARGFGPLRRLTADPGAQPTASYGGGTLGWLDAETIVFVAPDGQVHALPVAGGPSRQLTRLGGRVAAPIATPDGRWLACMVTTKTDQQIAVVDPRGERWPIRASRGGDFVFDPSWSASGALAWQEWNVPNMAWDASLIRLAKRPFERPSERDDEPRTIDGGEGVSVVQPRFSPDGRTLAYVSDRGGWWNLWLADVASGETRHLLADDAEYGGPTWGPGGMRYTWSPDGRQLAAIRTSNGFSEVRIVDVERGTARAIGPRDGSVQAVSWSPRGDALAIVWGSASQPTCLASVDVASGVTTVVAHGAPAGFEAAGTPATEAVSWPTAGHATAHGLLSRPVGVERPPLLVRIHGGPTGHVEAGFDARTAYWLDRGWAILQVNYRGSTGYGRAYRQALHGSWGLHDVNDTVSGARWLAERGLVDGERMVVMGGSAGGYTVLMCLALHPEVFAAGVDLYGVSDLFALSEETHRFEAHYTDTIVGPLPQAYALYRERSPLSLVDRIARPLLILQGDKDEVVPASQSEAIFKRLQARGVEVELKLYEGEGHGWRRLSTVLDELERVDRFLRRHVLRVARS